MIDVCLLGTAGMVPLPNRFLTALLVRYNGHLTLIDCGEGTQVSLHLLGWSIKNLDIICITHFHADHITGLPGVLLALSNAGRTEPITIIGPVGLEIMVKGLCVVIPYLPFEIIIKEFNAPSFSLTLDLLTISALSLDHALPCYGYRFDLARLGKFNAEKARALHIPIPYWSTLQKNQPINIDGQIYTPSDVLGSPRSGLRVSYITDTRPSQNIVDFVESSDLFICEGNYGDDERYEQAIRYRHCLFSESATMARNAHVSSLWLTHFSAGLNHPEDFLEKATSIFPNTTIGYDRLQTTLSFSNENQTE